MRLRDVMQTLRHMSDDDVVRFINHFENHSDTIYRNTMLHRHYNMNELLAMQSQAKADSDACWGVNCLTNLDYDDNFVIYDYTGRKKTIWTFEKKNEVIRYYIPEKLSKRFKGMKYEEVFGWM